MTTPTMTPLDQATADRLAAGFYRCFSHFEAGRGPLRRRDVLRPAAAVVAVPATGPGPGLRRAAPLDRPGAGRDRRVRTVPTATGFVTEHVETQRPPGGVMTTRRLHLCEVRDGRIIAVTTNCSGGWDDELRTRHAAEAPMIRP